MSRLRVLVIGAGLGGLALAQGLRQAGVEVEVFERDASPRGRMQGYRLRLLPEGEQALRDCAPQRVQELLTVTSNKRYNHGWSAYDENLVPQWTPTFDDPRGDADESMGALDRATLRRCLLAGLDDVVHFGRRFVRCSVSGDGGAVVAHFADGGTATGDVLVAADGANSQVRRHLRPGDQPTDLGVRTILSRTPRDRAIEAGLPEVVRDRTVYVIGSDGHHLGLMPMVYRTPPRDAARRLWPGLEFDYNDDYYMSVFNAQTDVLGMSDADFFAMDGEALRSLVLERTASWHPDLRAMFEHAEPAETFPIAMRVKLPVEHWEPGPVIPLGDAWHTMPPSGGFGANTALRDAAELSAALAAVDRGERDLADASGAYQTAMAEYATEAINTSLRIAQWSIHIDMPVQAKEAAQ
ncbi:FAD-dependent monooxygenase [Spirillospora sp. NPDC049652]